jgi:ketosteroid isomerase-like protein
MMEVSDTSEGGMPEPENSMDEVARQVRVALEGGDLSEFAELLDPDVTWGAPGARRKSCRNREQVLTWYGKGREAGVRAQVNDVTVYGDKILVSLVVNGSPAGTERGGEALRWQVLSVRQGRVADIVGFDDRRDALAEAGVAGSWSDASPAPGPEPLR